MANGTTPKQTEIILRRERVSRLYLARKSQWDIAVELGVDQATVSRDIAALQKQWKEASLTALDELKAQELARIDRLELEYWQAWADSKAKRTIINKKQTEAEGAKGGTRKGYTGSVREEDMLGDPRFLAGVQWCIDRRCQLLGLDAPKRQDITSGGQPLAAPVVYLPEVKPDDGG